MPNVQGHTFRRTRKSYALKLKLSFSIFKINYLTRYHLSSKSVDHFPNIKPAKHEKAVLCDDLTESYSIGKAV